MGGLARRASARMPAGRAWPASWCAPLAGYPTSNQTSRVAWPRILRCARCPKTRTRACSRSSTSAMREAACSTLACRPSLISPQVSRWRRRPPVHAMTVSTRPGASPATIAPPQCPRPRRRIDEKAGRSATATTRCTGSNSPLSTSASPRRGSSMLPARARPRARRPNHGTSPGLLDTRPNLGPIRPSAQEPRLATTASL